MLILAGVSINAIVGDNGILTRTQYATFLNEMAAVEEAVGMWKAGDAIENQGKTIAIPTNGMCKSTDITNTERLAGEVGYYRIWSMSETQPVMNILSSANEFNSNFESELVFYPAGVQDLYYLNNEACGIDSKKTYLIDAATGMVYSMTGINLKGVACYSSNMAKAVMNGDVSAPNFAVAEVSGTGSGEKLAGNVQSEFLEDGVTPNPNYNPNGFQIIAHETNDNIYKLYNNGDLYGKGIKGNLLNTELSKMEEINEYVWKEIDVTANVPNVVETISGYETHFYIDNNRNLWALGENRYNYLGLDANQQKEYTGREVIKLNVNDKKINKVIPAYSAIWVVTEDNELYVCGSNIYGQLGTGTIENQTNKFVKVQFDNPKNIKIITQPATFGVAVDVDYKTLILTNNGEMFFAGDTSKIYNNLFKNTEFEKTNVVQFIKIFNNIYGTEFESKIIDIGFFGSWLGQNFIMLDENGNLYRLFSNGTVELLDTNVNKFSSKCSGAVYEKNNEGTKRYMFCPYGGSANWRNLGLDSSTNNDSYKDEWIDITNILEESFNINKIKDFYMMHQTMLFLLNDGKVYGSGEKQFLGINENSDKTDGFVLIDGLNSIESFICNNHTANINGLILKDTEGKFYVTKSKDILFGNNILQSSWVKVNPEDVKVKKFHACTSSVIGNLAFIDDNNDIWVVGDDVRFLGINHATDDLDIHNFIRLKDYLENTEIYNHINGTVEDYSINQSAMYIKTNEKDGNKLYVCAPYRVDTWPNLSYSGLEENEDAYIPTEVLANVKKFVSTKNVGSVAILENGEVYIWGNNDKGTSGGINSLIPVKYTDTNGITNAFLKSYACYLLTNDNKIYVSGGVNNLDIACGLETESINTFVEMDSNQFNNEKIIDIAFLGTSSALFLSESGNLFAYGNKNYLGMNTELTEQVKTPINIKNNEDIVQIAGGTSWFIFVTKDGKVYGTGQNKFGVLGRWIGVGRGESNSRYKTAFSWVECPELEI